MAGLAKVDWSDDPGSALDDVKEKLCIDDRWCFRPAAVLNQREQLG